LFLSITSSIVFFPSYKSKVFSVLNPRPVDAVERFPAAALHSPARGALDISHAGACGVRRGARELLYKPGILAAHKLRVIEHAQHFAFAFVHL
jgi:hypothetical protein